jgi:hypothetical protein
MFGNLLAFRGCRGKPLCDSRVEVVQPGQGHLGLKDLPVVGVGTINNDYLAVIADVVAVAKGESLRGGR